MIQVKHFRRAIIHRFFNIERGNELSAATRRDYYAYSRRRHPHGSIQALGLSTFAFTVCFAVWTIFSIIGVKIKQDLGLNDTQFGLLVATPVLTGSVSRIFLGVWTEQFGGRIMFPLQMLITAVAVWLLTSVETYEIFLLAALGLGLAGGSFIVGVAYTSRWFEPEHQGTALGIFGAGNVGAAVTNFAAPFLVVALGWEDTARIYAVVLAITAVLFYLLAKTDPVQAERKRSGSRPVSTGQQLEPLKNIQVWRFRDLLLLRLWRLRGLGFLPAALLRRRLWAGADNGRRLRGSLFAARLGVPRARRLDVRQARRAVGHVFHLHRFARRAFRDELSRTRPMS